MNTRNTAPSPNARTQQATNHNQQLTEKKSSESLQKSPADPSHKPGDNDSYGLSEVQQQFVLKFCRQLASVIEACEQSESAEIEVGRRQINTRQIKVKLQAEREL